jgi:hypothetical protein
MGRNESAGIAGRNDKWNGTQSTGRSDLPGDLGPGPVVTITFNSSENTGRDDYEVCSD